MSEANKRSATKQSNKAADHPSNIYEAARLKAARRNPMLSTKKSAARALGIRSQNFSQIEQSDPQKKQCAPSPDIVLLMSQKYNAPELKNYYCTHQCPLRMEHKKELSYDDLDKISVGLLSSVLSLQTQGGLLSSILKDSKISREECVALERIIGLLNELSQSAEALDLWLKMNRVNLE